VRFFGQCSSDIEAQRKIHEVTAFGGDPRGAIPRKSTLHYPQSGIKDDWGEYAFSACAAKN
jgi:hypothetical protein